MLIRNAWIRFIAVFGQIWRFLSQQFSRLWQLFSTLLGYDREGYFLDAEPTSQSPSQPNPTIATPTPETKPSPTPTSERPSRSRSNRNTNSKEMDYYRDLARQIRPKA
ncbi:MAG: hypothetical protein IGS54_06460 [Elainella sp. C42_A2020_010]|nr:hypothetical protein [Elainella sp. C42_A2020_010]